MTDKKNQKTPKEVTKLSEWQRRNQEYQKKKQLEEQEEKEKKAQEEKERQELLNQKTPSEDLNAEEQDTETAEEENEKEADLAEEELQEILPDETDEEDEEEKIIYLTEPSEDMFEEEELAKKAKKEGQIARRHIYRAIPVLVISTLIALFSAYLLTPLAKQKIIEFSGNKNADQTLLFEKSRIQDRDYTLTTFLNRDRYLANMKAASPWVKDISMTYAFPTTFKVQVEEYQVFGYYVTEEDHYPILENGEVVETPVAADQLPKAYLAVRFSDRELVRQFVKQLGKIPSSVRDEIESVDLTPSKVTKDLVTLTMKDGTKVLVPVSQIKRKLPYYHQIRKLIEDDSVIDMEAGIYSYNAETMATLAQEKKEKEEGEGNKTEEADANSTDSDESAVVTEQHEEVPAE
ncbi:cell division protein FtsQ/DivIB [Streptococcus australis]|uniref:cell division protein FtsQ/DivIB n=1 Tax=Streptococcus australis TaxID=113107 RepID=UPI00232F60B8|nr:cell division protein FtsQ/DivIB [Streptococcus australis]MDB8642236.1 FtsQ-type POTRA domain-containing protein [Streptococcus australis]MDB8646160.1 FtsQ-type POTRA domain-containing protein [Streptococcus australis]